MICQKRRIPAMGKSDRGTDFDGRANRALHYQAQCRRQRALDWANKVELELSEDEMPDSYWDTVPDLELNPFEDFEEMRIGICLADQR